MSRDGCPIDAIIEHNRLEVEATGERHLLRDFGLLESALARPRNFYGFGEDDIAALAVALLNGVARAHAFEQGNKRTAFGAMRLFLIANGYDTAFEDTVSWADGVIAPCRASVGRGGFLFGPFGHSSFRGKVAEVSA